MKAARWLRGLLWLTTLLAAPTWAQSDELPPEPMLRINAPSHIAALRGIATDAAERFAVTASDDKTVRVWSLPDGVLQRVIWLPSGDGNLGKAYAVALSPDGTTIAVGGWTGPTVFGINVYLFDRASGALVQRLSGLPNVVTHLAFSSDGKRLAVALWGANGIRVFDAAKGYQSLPSDSNYGASSFGLDFDRTDRLVSASTDGFVRIYTVDKYDKPAVPKVTVQGINRPYSVAFSPDGGHIAVGDYDSSTIAVLHDRDLKPEIFPAVTDFGATQITVAWSQDGQQLFAQGHHLDHFDRLARRWDEAGAGSFVDIDGARDMLMQFFSRHRQSMLFADQHGFGVIDASGKARRLQGRGGIDIRDDSSLKISSDARTVKVTDHTSGDKLQFALARRVVVVNPAEDKALTSAITQSDRIKVTDWENTTAPKLNDANLSLERDEISHSLALVPGTDRFVLGAQWSLRQFDARGKEVWPEPHSVPGEAWGANVSADGRLIVAAYGDGTIRWHRLSDGTELLALFMHPDGKRWVAWTPQGYYDASAGADDLIGWQVNHGYDKAPDYFPAKQFSEQFNRPDIVALVLDTLDEDEAVRRANTTAKRKSPAPVTDLLPPVVKILAPSDLSSVLRSPIDVTYLVRSPTPVTGITVLVDGRPVDTPPPITINAGADGSVESVTVPMPQHPAKISLIAANAQATSVAAIVNVGWQGEKDWYKPDLYVLAIGAAHYKDASLQLSYPAKDAADFAVMAHAQESGLYNHVEVRVLADEHATREEIRKGLSWLKKTPTRDVAMLFLSGHGQNDAGGHYHYLPYDTDESDLDLTTIQDFEIEDFLGKVPGKVIAFLDTCFAGGAAGKKGPTQPDIDSLANKLAKADKGVVVFTSSTGRQFSQEKDEWKNGAFTKALVEALRGGADYQHDKMITIAALEVYLSHRVQELTNGEQSPATAKPTTIPDLTIARVVP